MRPRSTLLSKRRLLQLPTIREGTEETLRELNEAKTLLHSNTLCSEDYLLSICHLAHPTFPITTRDVHVSPDNSIQAQRLGRTLRLSVRTSGWTPSNNFATETQEQGQEQNGSDPLEYLYGHQDHLSGGVRTGRFTRDRHGQAHSRAHSFPHVLRPDTSPCQRKSSCPEFLHTHGTARPDISVPNVSQTTYSLTAMLSEVREGSTEEAERQERQERQHSPNVKQSLISQWISDCRSAWKETRMRACMLPAIVEI